MDSRKQCMRQTKQRRKLRKWHKIKSLKLSFHISYPKTLRMTTFVSKSLLFLQNANLGSCFEDKINGTHKIESFRYRISTGKMENKWWCSTRLIFDCFVLLKRQFLFWRFWSIFVYLQGKQGRSIDVNQNKPKISKLTKRQNFQFWDKSRLKMRSCLVCPVRRNAGLFPFPKDEGELQKWCANLCLNPEEIKSTSFLCYKHFLKSQVQFVKWGNRARAQLVKGKSWKKMKQKSEESSDCKLTVTSAQKIQCFTLFVI